MKFFLVLSKRIILGLGLTVLAAAAQQIERKELGRLPTGATVSFIRPAGGEWGIEISGVAPRLMQQKPVQIEIMQTGDKLYELTAGYKTVRPASAEINAVAEIAFGDRVVFHVKDHWKLTGAVISLRRKIEVAGNAQGGFNSSVRLLVDPSVSWPDVNCLAPGALYGDPTYNGERSPGGTLNHAGRRFLMREDILPAPLFALAFNNGSSVSLFDPSPRCESTVEETRLVHDVMVDARFQFGALGACQEDTNPIELGFQFPGATTLYPFGPNASAIDKHSSGMWPTPL